MRVIAPLRSLVVVAAACGAWSVGCGDDGAPPAEQTQESVADAEAPPTSPRDAGRAEDAAPQGPRVECAIGSAIEIEPNDTRATATPFTELSLCGVLATSADVDFLTFETPPGTKLSLFQAVVEGGKVDFELTLGNETFGPADVERFGSGTYVVKAFTASGKPGSYRIRVQFDPS